MTQIKDQRVLIRLQKEEIARQISKRKFAEQTRNWTIILVVVIHLLIWIL